MPIPNDFLINLLAHNNVVGNCFCGNCRRLRFDNLHGKSLDEMYVHLINNLPLRKEQRLDHHHTVVLLQIVYGERYKATALQNSPYKKFGWWAKANLQLSEKDRKHFCQKVTEASLVFNHWDNIVNNLTNQNMKYIDARTFSVRMFYLANSYAWCVTYNEKLRMKGKVAAGEEPYYPPEKIEDIFQHIQNTGILADVDFNPQAAAAIGEQIQSRIVNYCIARKQFQP